MYENLDKQNNSNFFVNNVNITIIYRRATSLPRENDEGFIEYKWKLVNIKRDRMIRLITQMNYRLNEGNGKSIYAIGYSDDGFAKGITKGELITTINNISLASEELGANITKILFFIDNATYCAKIFIIHNINII